MSPSAFEADTPVIKWGWRYWLLISMGYLWYICSFHIKLFCLIVLVFSLKTTVASSWPFYQTCMLPLRGNAPSTWQLSNCSTLIYVNPSKKTIQIQYNTSVCSSMLFQIDSMNAKLDAKLNFDLIKVCSHVGPLLVQLHYMFSAALISVKVWAIILWLVRIPYSHKSSRSSWNH